MEKEIANVPEALKAKQKRYKQLTKEAKSLEQEIAKETESQNKLDEFCDYETPSGILKKKAAYIKQNRMIDSKKVDEFGRIINRNEYESAYPIIVSDAKKFSEQHPDITICDAYGNAIKQEELSDYFVHIDGQHRGRAFILLIALGEYQKPIPGVVIKNEIPDVGKYLCSINPKGSWSNKDKVQVCALTVKGKYADLMKKIDELVRRGFNRSTASQIYCGKPITSSQFDKLLTGTLNCSISFNLNNGDFFIKSCEEAGISVKYLTKRYFIEGFLDYKTETGEDSAHNALSNLPKMTDKELKAVKSKDDFITILKEVNNKLVSQAPFLS